MMWDTFSSRGGGLGRTAVELSQLRRTWSAEFIPLPADLHVPRGGGLKSALLNSTAVGQGEGTGSILCNVRMHFGAPPSFVPDPAFDPIIWLDTRGGKNLLTRARKIANRMAEPGRTEPCSCINVERELNRSIVNPGRCTISCSSAKLITHGIAP